MNSVERKNFDKKWLHEFFDYLIKKFEQNQDSYDYVVLTTRRCFCLFYALMQDDKFMDSYKSKQQIVDIICGKIVSSQKIDIIGNSFKDKIVLLIDDIMIHGKSATALYHKISHYCPKKISTLVLIRNSEFPDQYLIKTKNQYDVVIYKDSWEWRKDSNDFVRYLHDMGQLYISYIYGYKVKLQNLNTVLNNNEYLSKIISDFSLEIGHETYNNGNEPQYFYFKKYDQYSFIKYSFLRVYKAKINDTETIKIIPYLELEDFGSSNIKKIWNLIWRKGLPSELKVIQCASDIYKALSVVLSFMMFLELFGSEISICETKEIDKSFVDNFISIIKNNVVNNVFDVISREYKKISFVDKNYYVNTIMYETLNNKFCQISNNTEIKEFFYLVGENEEKENADYVDPNRFNPLPTSIFYTHLDVSTQKNLFAFLLYILDNGIASHVVREEGNIVGTHIKPGEQSYHLFSDIVTKYLRSIFMVLSYIDMHYDDVQKDEIKDKFCNQLVKNKEYFSQDEINSIKFIIQNAPFDLRSSYFGVQHLVNIKNDKLDLFKQMLREVISAKD